MSLINTTLVAVAAAAEESGHNPVIPFIAAGIAFAVFLMLGIVAWSYRDVANRSTRGRDAAGHGHDSH